MNEQKQIVELGTEVKDPITGYEGIAVCRTVYLYGCARIGVQSKVMENGKVPILQYFDELQLKAKEPDREKGGPRAAEVKRAFLAGGI